MVTIKTYRFSNTPHLALEGWDFDALSGKDYDSDRANALYKALGVEKSDDEYTLAQHNDGRWGLFGMTVEGHPFATETIQTYEDARRRGLLTPAPDAIGLHAFDGTLLAQEVPHEDSAGGWVTAEVIAQEIREASAAASPSFVSVVCEQGRWRLAKNGERGILAYTC